MSALLEAYDQQGNLIFDINNIRIMRYLGKFPVSWTYLGMVGGRYTYRGYTSITWSSRTHWVSTSGPCDIADGYHEITFASYWSLAQVQKMYSDYKASPSFVNFTDIYVF